MERYTYMDGGKWRLRAGDTEYSGPWVDRLAAYEDTGLEPDGIDEALNEAHDLGYKACLNYKGSTWSEAAELQAYRALGTVEELTALVKDWDEGRVHIDPPPAKEGDPQPDCFEDYGGSLWCLGYQRSENVDEPCDRCKRCWYCKNGDYADASPEAEAALGGGGDG